MSLYGSLQEYDLYLTGYLRDQVVLELDSYTFTIPYGTFRHSNPNEQLEYTALQSDGSPLPNWLDFDPKKLKFSGMPPKGSQNIEVLVKAKDGYGNEAFATFKVTVKKEHGVGDKEGIKVDIKHPKGHGNYRVDKVESQQLATSKSGFSEQLSVAGKLSRLTESRALLDSLNQL